MAGRLMKSSRNRMLFGVAGGLAEYLRVDPVIVRAVFILLAFANGIGVLVYLILALVMPRPETPAGEPLAVIKDNIKAAPRETSEAGRRVVSVLRGPAEPPQKEDAPRGDEPPVGGDGAGG